MFHLLFINNSGSQNDYLHIIECTVLHFLYINVLYVCAATHYLHITKYGLSCVTLHLGAPGKKYEKAPFHRLYKTFL